MVRSAITAVAIAVVMVAGAVAWPGVHPPDADPDAVASASPVGAATPPTTRPSQLSAADAERAFTVALNRRRTKLGLPALVTDPALTTMARNWSAHMAATEKLAHNPNLTTEAPAGWYKLGENVGVGGTIAAIHVAFLRSPEHYRNVVDRGFDRVGIGVVVQQYIVWVSVEFEQPESSRTGRKT